MRRRGFLTGCGVLAGVTALEGPGALARAAGELRFVPGRRALLLGEGKAPLRAAGVVPHRSYVFAYPFEGTPCFLLNLDRVMPGMRVTAERGGGAYDWEGGVGAGRSVVAFSAICPHAYTHPTRDVAMIHYDGADTPAVVAGRTGVITCCAHGSTFDPARGAVPLQPPAEIPLAGVVLEWDERADALYARGVVGRPVFEEFFRSFPERSRQEVGAVTPVWELARYSRSVLGC